jgi:hypothetical protein
MMGIHNPLVSHGKYNVTFNLFVKTKEDQLVYISGNTSPLGKNNFNLINTFRRVEGFIADGEN